MSDHNSPKNSFGATPDRDFRKLVHRSLDAALTEAEVQKLEADLDSDPALRRWYAEAVMLHADLFAHSEARELCREVIEEFPQDGEVFEDDGRVEVARTGSLWGFTRALQMPVAASLLAAGLLAGCGVGLLTAAIVNDRHGFNPAPWDWSYGSDVVARVVSTHEAEWQPARSPETPPTKGLRVGQQIRLDSGRLQLAFRDGVNVILHGPAVFAVRSEDGGKLFSGRMTITAPDGPTPFGVATPAGQFLCGAGHYGIEVGSGGSYSNNVFNAFVGASATGATAQFVAISGEKSSLHEGQAIAVGADGKVIDCELANVRDFSPQLPLPSWEPFDGEEIWLSNLFDDGKSASLNEAMATDTFRAAGETIDLGIAAVHDGGLDVDVSLAERGVRFSFAEVGGGGPRVNGLPGNDSYRSISKVPIRTSGESFGDSVAAKKIEDGIGMSTNEMLTFDLDELRDAGRLGNRAMRLIVDRAGLNDRLKSSIPPLNLASARFIVVVSTSDEVLAGYVDGKAYDVVRRGSVYSFDLSGAELPPVLRRDGRFVSFDVPVPPEAKYLTLATAMHDVEHDDHAVFSGARLLIEPGQNTLAGESTERLHVVGR